MLTVRIPTFFNKSTMYSFIDSVIDDKMEPRDQQIKFDFSSLSFIEPAGVTILSNIIEWLKSRNVLVIVSYPSNTKITPTEGIKYLDDSMFFKYYLKETLTNKASIRPTTMPLKFITFDMSYSWLEMEFLPWLSNQLNVSVSSLASIKVGFGEIFNNIRDHADEETGCIFAQHYPSKDQIKISISDFGVGIPNTIRKIYPHYNDKEALAKSIEEGISSRSTPRNRGAGLGTLLQNIVINYGGITQIRSYSGILTVSRNKMNNFVVNCSETHLKYPGTFFEIMLNTNNFSDHSEEEDFEWDW